MKCIVGNQLVDENAAKVSPFDRGYLFGDGIYEVIAVVEGKMLDAEKHWRRLERSCAEISLPLPADIDDLKTSIRALGAINGLTEGRIYFQITRGVADRDFAFADDLEPQLFAFCRQVALVDTQAAASGISAITTDDLRWKRRDIKSIALLPQTLAKQEAKLAGAGEAVMCENGFITEGSSSTIYAIKNDILITRTLNNEVLPGVTRDSLLGVAEKLGLKTDIRPISCDEIYDTDEMFLSSAGALVQGIVKLDERAISDGKIGPWTQKLRDAYLAHALTLGQKLK